MAQPGWEVLMDAMEELCDVSERQLLASDIANSAQIVANHSRAKAYREFFEKLQKTVITFAGEKIETPQLTPEELIRKQWQE